jgi:hypothetical protein
MQAVTSIEFMPAGRPASLDTWRKAIVQGNQAFAQRDDIRALAQYRIALSLAQAMLGQIEDAQAGIAALVVAHHNIADTCMRLQLHEERARHLCGAHERLHRIMGDAAMPPAWKDAALRQSRITCTELTAFLAAWPDHARARAAANLNAAVPMSGHEPH